MNVAVILAGGIGSRVGAGIPKQFIEVLGKPILAYTIEPFEKHPAVDAILVVCVKPYLDFVWEMKEKYGLSKIKWVTEGGTTFQKSVVNGVNYLWDKVCSDDTVLFHFGASPFIKEDIITDAIRVCKEKGTNAISTTDYLLLSGIKKTSATVLDPANYTVEYIDRDTIAVMNTPHAFQYGFIAEIYKEAMKTGIIDTVEPHTTTLMYAMGKKIYFSKGSQTNIKITTKEDIEMFEGYVLKQQRKTKEQISGDVVVLLADGFEECEGLIVVDMLRRAGLKVLMASIMGKRDVKSSQDILIMTDCLAENVDYEKAKIIVLPGGRLGIDNLKNSELVKKQCKAFATDKYVGFVCAMPSILASLGLFDRKYATVRSVFEGNLGETNLTRENVTIDGNIVTGQGMGAAIPFSLKLIEILIDKATALTIEKTIGYR